ncbi:hypothetical protein KHS38_01395 [Mucilaginibacter sp. Bleaf8]|uniref:tail fiber protein n=1 Tax=Mucilaginibacter sp. Bleaf8 TaxID=2834430 RepID=UPI001BCF2F39|nr:tail fiber protein [Mucilaginibacter sp. Bleaf8]MBS7563045.1 hypothetical protein [Mucilaginibacter sp. Bleaf8]
MKKLCFSLLAGLIAGYTSNAQTVIPQLSPNGGPMNSSGSWVYFASGGTKVSIQETWGLNLTGAADRPVRLFNSSLLVGYAGYGINYGTDNAYISGNVGIGTYNTFAKLQIQGGFDTNDGRLAIVQANKNNGNYASLFLKTDDDPTNSRLKTGLMATGVGSWGVADLSFILNGEANHNNATIADTKMIIKASGKVGIGTQNPDAQLTVKGTIHASEVRVDINVPAPDYVFDKDYKIRPLVYLEEYISTNKHLPEIPSAKAIEKEGVNLSEMNMKLLKKVEELTLYLIEQNKQQEGLRHQLKYQQKEINQLKKQIKPKG